MLKSRLAEIQADRREVCAAGGAAAPSNTCWNWRDIAGQSAQGALWRRNLRCLRDAEEPPGIRGRRPRRSALSRSLRDDRKLSVATRTVCEVFDRMLVEFFARATSSREARRSRTARRPARTNPLGRIGGAYARGSGALDEQREELVHRLERSEDLLARMLRRDDPAELRAALTELDKPPRFPAAEADALTPQIEIAQQKIGFLSEQTSRRARRLPEPARKRQTPFRRGGNRSLRFPRATPRGLDRASRAPRSVYSRARQLRDAQPASGYCPPVHLQQLRKALVMREELKRVEEILNQFPARQFSIKRLEEASRRLRRYSRRKSASWCCVSAKT